MKITLTLIYSKTLFCSVNTFNFLQFINRIIIKSISLIVQVILSFFCQQKIVFDFGIALQSDFHKWKSVDVVVSGTYPKVTYTIFGGFNNSRYLLLTEFLSNPVSLPRVNYLLGSFPFLSRFPHLEDQVPTRCCKKSIS